MSQTQFSHNSLSYGTGCTRIMFGSAPQWNFQLRRHFHNLIFQNLKEVSHKSFVFTSSIVTFQGGLARNAFCDAFSSCRIRRSCAQFYCVLRLRLCRSPYNGCVKVAWRRGCVRNVFCLLQLGSIYKVAILICQQIFSILALLIFLLNFR